jgi:hypothetical protein
LVGDAERGILRERVGAGLAGDPYMYSARVAPAARAGPGLPVAAAVEPVADLLTEGLMTPS